MQSKAIKNDKYKDYLAKINGYDLIRIWEKDFNTKPKIVKEEILKEIKTINKKLLEVQPI